ncbi:spore germination protein [Oceanobacillus sp. FSL K6-2867]|uniref:spore germination protein n=1 Tax=Oceanobacillus sp. FSL K6-2867 TaxID=2954748 RepID=UPI0030DB7943
MARSTLINRIKNRKQQNNDKARDKAPQQVNLQVEITKDLDCNVKNSKEIFGNPDDLVIRELMIGSIEKRSAIVYISGLTDEDLINNNILKTIQLNMKDFKTNILEDIYEEVVAITAIKKTQSMDEVSLAILNGSTAFYIDGSDTVLIMETAGGERRSIEEPDSETLVRGPRDGFVESIDTNLALIRRDIKDTNLRFKGYEIGKRTKQKLVMVYMEGIVNPEIVQEVDRRLKSIDTDYVSDSSHVEQWIEDSFLSPFPQLLDTERPDRVSSNVIKGKVVILLNGSPFALIAPITIGDALHSMEDYSQRWVSATLLRALRYLTAFFAMFLPALYIALVSYHPGMIPSTLTYSIAGSREGVPFPSAIEAFLMALTFEILHEAGVRLPKVIGQTIGIVGGLVIGEAAVSAGIVSPIMVVVTALTAIASFSIPAYSVAVTFRVLRFACMIAASLLGLYGVILVYIMVNIHIVNLKSIGIPYSTPFAPTFVSDWRDLVLRAPFTILKKNPKYLKTVNNESAENDGKQGKE